MTQFANKRMKTIISAIIILTAQTVLAIPSAVWIEIEQGEKSIHYSIEDIRTSSFEQFSSKLRELAPAGKQYPSSELHFHVHVKGHINISEILRIKKELKPFGFDHYTIQSIPQYGTIITVTIGKPEDTQLFNVKKLKPISPDENK